MGDAIVKGSVIDVQQICLQDAIDLEGHDQ